MKSRIEVEEDEYQPTEIEEIEESLYTLIHIEINICIQVI